MHAYLHIQMKSSYFHLVFPNNHHVVEHCFAFSYTLYDFGVGAFIVHKCMITDQRERQRERECISCEGRERAPANNRASKTRAATQNSTSRVCVVACGVVVVVPPVPRRVPFTRVHTFRFLRCYRTSSVQSRDFNFFRVVQLPNSPFNMSAVRLALPSRVYQLLIRRADPMVPAKMRNLWEHPAGICTRAARVRGLARDIENRIHGDEIRAVCSVFLACVCMHARQICASASAWWHVACISHVSDVGWYF